MTAPSGSATGPATGSVTPRAPSVPRQASPDAFPVRPRTAGRAARRRPSPATLAGLLTVAALVCVGLVLLPGQRARMIVRSTVVAPPAGFDGLPRSGGAEVESFLGRLAQRRRWDGSLGRLAFVGGLYGNGTGETVLVLAAKATEPLSPGMQASVRQGLAATLTGSGARLTLIGRDPGELGGWFGCGRRGGVTACVATDQASAVAVLVTNVTGDPAATALRVREATVHRR